MRLSVSDTRPTVSRCDRDINTRLLQSHSRSGVVEAFTTHDEPVEHVRCFSHTPVSVRGRANEEEMCTKALNRRRNINYCVCLEEKGAAT